MKRLPRISAKVNASTLEEVLDGLLSWGQMLRGAMPSMLNARTTVDVAVGFVPHADHPAEILVTPMPLRGTMIPVVSLAYRSGCWSATPQIVNAGWLSERQAIEIQPTDWISALATLVADLHVQRDWRDIDMAPWAITTAWPEWQAADLSWEKPAKDLAKRLGTNPMSPNTLMVKCRRMGLRKL